MAGKIVEKSQPSISKTVRQDIDDADDEESYYKWLEVIILYYLFILKRVSAKASGKLIKLFPIFLFSQLATSDLYHRPGFDKKNWF